MKKIVRWISLWFSAPGAGDEAAEILAADLAYRYQLPGPEASALRAYLLLKGKRQ